MPVQLHRIKPIGTMLVSVEIRVSYSCDSPPQVISTKIRGLRKFALIIGHEYDIEAEVADYRCYGCPMDGCSDAVYFDYALRILVADVIGFGLSIGDVGTGTAGVSLKATEEVQDKGTPPVCCDKSLGAAVQRMQDEESMRRRFDPMPLIVGFALMAFAGTLSVLQFDHPSNLGKLFLSATSVGVIVSLFMAFRRLRVRRMRRRDVGERATHTVGTG